MKPVCLKCGREIRPQMDIQVHDNALPGAGCWRRSCNVCVLDWEVSFSPERTMMYGTARIMWQFVPKGALAVFAWEPV